MNTLLIDGQLYKLVKVDKPKFALKSEVDESKANIEQAALSTLTGETQIASASLPVIKDCIKFNDEYYAYYPVKNKLNK